MPDQPLIPPPPATPARPRRKGRMGLRILPFIPILLAILIAFIIRQFPNRPTPMMEKELIGAKAPDFSLRDAHKAEGDDPVTLSLLIDKSAVLIIFFRSYSCPRCVACLSAITDELEAFTKAGIQVIAISPDSPANTRDSIQTYGDFPFPLLSDRDDKVARAYGLLASDGTFFHGVFIVDQDRRIQFAVRVVEPYTDTQNLLDAGKKLQIPR
jgi:peroxiredoxin